MFCKCTTLELIFLLCSRSSFSYLNFLVSAIGEIQISSYKEVLPFNKNSFFLKKKKEKYFSYQGGIVFIHIFLRGSCSLFFPIANNVYGTNHISRLRHVWHYGIQPLHITVFSQLSCQAQKPYRHSSRYAYD